ncbi:CubicO group peptidase (beta-lactamase class C family) [Nocardiopsis mwathae]|uniref:CubicO group peptidase (Beta-lactamase class C family) n=1 Tax=Nocardiopsis mwathae TaxID=1472723 RepID=A0A7W9YJ80_9ACTN|nr:serine hydrolase domain-containing protein [Nocardiopsis mwathae]MBB6172531.1 CubicO group peptidase (beta-lactamase class C family) [Nocardiopsis mwathae]
MTGSTGKSVTRREFGTMMGAAGIGSGLAGGLGAGPVHAAAGAEREWRVGGIDVPSLRPFDAAMKEFMQRRGISAGQLAVTDGGRLVLARSYAWTDDGDLRFGPTALFRIASMSKPILGAAVNLLAQRGGIGMGDPITDHLDLVPLDGERLDPRLPLVTVERALQLLGGWDNAQGDLTVQDIEAARALGASLPVDIGQMVRYGAGKSLAHAPGTTYAYSNFGYMLLGEIVADLTGRPYDAFVRNDILAPLGITRMRVARTLAEHRAPTEVHYVSQHTGTTVMDDSGAQVPAPYGTIRMENRAAFGGWLSSAVDMVRFASLYDSHDILGPDAVRRTFAEPETGVNEHGWYYGHGWFVSPAGTSGGFTASHGGGLPGTATFMARTHDGLSWAALFNQSDDPSGLPYQEAIATALPDAAARVEAWPDHDLYDEYF